MTETEVKEMGIAISLLLIAGGAILAWAVTAEAEGVDLNQVGVIMFIVGAIGMVVSLFYEYGGSYVPFRRRTVIHEDDYEDVDTVHRHRVGR